MRLAPTQASLRCRFFVACAFSLEPSKSSELSACIAGQSSAPYLNTRANPTRSTSTPAKSRDWPTITPCPVLSILPPCTPAASDS